MLGYLGGGPLQSRRAVNDGRIHLLIDEGVQLLADLQNAAAQRTAKKLRHDGAEHRGRLADGRVHAFQQRHGQLAGFGLRLRGQIVWHDEVSCVEKACIIIPPGEVNRKKRPAQGDGHFLSRGRAAGEPAARPEEKRTTSQARPIA